MKLKKNQLKKQKKNIDSNWLNLSNLNHETEITL